MGGGLLYAMPLSCRRQPFRLAGMIGRIAKIEAEAFVACHTYSRVPVAGPDGPWPVAG